MYYLTFLSTAPHFYVNAIFWQRGKLLTGEMKTSLQNNSAKIIMENKFTSLTLELTKYYLAIFFC